jgi:RHS repeat-associated protein
VSSVTNGGVPNSVTATYSYDANGNLSSSSGTIYPASGSVTFSRTLTYKSFNAPAALTHVQGGATYSYTYTYSVEHERVKLVTVRPDDTLTSIYVHPAGKGALLYEKEIRQSTAVVEHKHYVNGGSGLVGVFVTKSSYVSPDGPAMRYYHRDHLGSIVAITNPVAAVIERLAYEPFGERRYPNGSAENRASPLIGITTDRGFTAHEHLDEMMLIHMNGRLYDPLVARFMTSDPLVSDPRDLQNYNRYAYTLNNPLRFVDPTGYNHGMISWQNKGLENAYKGMSLMWTIDVTTYDGGNNDSVPSGNSSDTSGPPNSVSLMLQRLPDYGQKPQLGSGVTNWSNTSLDQNTQLASADVQHLLNGISDFARAFADRVMSGETAADISNYGSGQFLFDIAMVPLGGPLGGPVAKGGLSLIGQTFGKLGTIVNESGLAINGFTSHGLDQAITRGVSPAALLDAVRNPLAVLQQGSGNFLHIGEETAVVLNNTGRVVTTYPASMYDSIVESIANAARAVRGGP